MLTTIFNASLKATINSRGAELISLQNNSCEFIWEGNPAIWGKHSPVLFPIVGTLKNNSYQYDGKNYSLSRHGFARDMEFELLCKTENSVVFSLQSSKTTLKCYPFKFQLLIIYTLENNTLHTEYKVLNKSMKKMPFSIGAHPAFALPDFFENYSLQFEEVENPTYYLLENDLIADETKILNLNNNQLNLNYNLFENDALVFKTFPSKSLSILKSGIPFLKINFNDFPNLGIWTKIQAPFICIEPWFGYSDTVKSENDLFKKEGIQIINVNSTFQSKFSIEIL